MKYLNYAWKISFANSIVFASSVYWITGVLKLLSVVRQIVLSARKRLRCVFTRTVGPVRWPLAAVSLNFSDTDFALVPHGFMSIIMNYSHHTFTKSYVCRDTALWFRIDSSWISTVSLRCGIIKNAGAVYSLKVWKLACFVKNAREKRLQCSHVTGDDDGVDAICYRVSQWRPPCWFLNIGNKIWKHRVDCRPATCQYLDVLHTLQRSSNV